MPVSAFPHGLEAHDTDIEAVGGKGAYTGMWRKDDEGREYVLCLSAEEIEEGRVLRINDPAGGGEFEVEKCTTTSDLAFGYNSTGDTSNIPSGHYMWVQVRGTNRTRIASTVGDGLVGPGSLGFLVSHAGGAAAFCGYAKAAASGGWSAADTVLFINPQTASTGQTISA